MTPIVQGWLDSAYTDLRRLTLEDVQEFYELANDIYGYIKGKVEIL